eukprot:symbB.v1.2.026328.t1/scaffold2622.1/size74630/4
MLIGGVRRYHSAQREHLSEVRAFRGALEKEDQEYFKNLEAKMRRGRRTPRSEEDEEGMSRQDLQERLAQAGFRLEKSELELLWETLDTNQDGRLSLSELGMSDEMDGPRRHCGHAMKLNEGGGFFDLERGAYDLIAWGAKVFSPPGGTFGADKDYCHIGISELQYLLLKCCLLMGVTVELGVEFRDTIYRAGQGWVALTEPALVSNELLVDALVCCDGAASRIAKSKGAATIAGGLGKEGQAWCAWKG